MTDKRISAAERRVRMWIHGRLAVVLVWSIAACEGRGCRQAPAPTVEFLEAHRDRYRESISRGRRWLDSVDVDPFDLRSRGIKGKKKLVESLDAYYRLWRVAETEQERQEIRARVLKVAAVTYEARYHDMLDVDDTRFKQDATSYLRAALLLDRMGLDVQLYRDQIQRIHARLNAHMKLRGPHQQRVFHWYYQHFGLSEPFRLSAALARGVIARRPNAAELSVSDAYDVTHEVFGPYEFGDRLDVDPFAAEDKQYLRQALPVLITRFIHARNPDLVAELVSCVRLLRMTEMPEYRAGLSYLLESQNPDGSWGDYAREKRRLGAYVRQGYHLHTTMVVVDALTLTFHRAWNPAD